MCLLAASPQETSLKGLTTLLPSFKFGDTVPVLMENMTYGKMSSFYSPEGRV